MHARTRCTLLGAAAALAGASIGAALTWHDHGAANTRSGVAPAHSECSSYIDVGRSGWFVDQWGYDSLRIVPTSCGRQIGSDGTPVYTSTYSGIRDVRRQMSSSVCIEM